MRPWGRAAGLVTIALSLCVWHRPAQAADPQPSPHRWPDRLAKREEWFYRQRAYPSGRIPKDARLRLWRQKQELEEERRAALPEPLTALGSGASVLPWTFIGPQPANFLGPNSGRVTALAVDPRNSQVVWAGAADGGVWKTTDGGQHWTALTDNQPTLSTGSLALDPSSPDTVYVGTGEANFSGDEYAGVGILKSSDGGATWTNYPGPFNGSSIGAISVSPAAPSLVLAGSAGGIFRSADGGATWANVLPGSFGSAVLFDPGGLIAWAGIGDFGDASDGVYKSTDGGLTWTRQTGTASSVLPPANQIGRVAIALAPSSPSTILVGIGYMLGRPHSGSGVYRSSDGGKTWQFLAQPGYDPNWYENALAVSPVNPSLMIGGGGYPSVSTDGGRTWDLKPLGIHPDQHVVAFSKDGSIAYIGGDGGVYRITDAENPQASWTDLNSTLGVTQFYPGMSLEPANVNVAIGGTQDNSTLRYSGSLQWDAAGCGDGGGTAIDPVNPANIYISCMAVDQPVYKSTDAGADFLLTSQGLDATENFPWPTVLAIDQGQPNILYFAGNQHIYQSRDGASSWQTIPGDVTGGLGAPSAIAVAPSSGDTVYVGTSGGVVQVTQTARSTPGWTNRTAGLPKRAITAIAVDRGNPNAAYVMFSGFGSGHVFVTPDAGVTWRDISGNLPDGPVNDLAIDPDLPGVLYAGTDAGVFATVNQGISWSPWGVGLPNAVVTGVRFHQTTRTLRVSTHGRGMWDLFVPTAVPPLLSLTMNHSDPFIQGYDGFAYTVTVTNTASAPTSGSVSVTETVPDGLMLYSMDGAGWNCAGAACTRSDVLNPGRSYPAITVTVNVASNAPLQVTNRAQVSGGGAAGATVSDITQIVPPAVTPYISSLSPTAAAAGGPAFTLTVTGVNFVSGAQVLFGGAYVPGTRLETTFVSSTQLTASVPASLIANLGSNIIEVVNPGAGNAVSEEILFPVRAAGGLGFYPVTPCRVSETEADSGKTDAFGRPVLSAGTAHAGCRTPQPLIRSTSP